MFLTRERLGPVELAFTDRLGGVSAYPYDQLNLALGGGDDPEAVAQNLALVQRELGPDDALADLRQVHGRAVAVVDDATPLGDAYERPEADAILTARPGVTLLVRVADCVPILLADPDARVVGAVHAGREGLVAGVVPAALEGLERLGARRLQAWIGPHVCGHCYEVPLAMREEVGAAHPAAVSTTWSGTPSLDLGAAVAAQLSDAGVQVSRVEACTKQRADLYSHRRDAAESGRLGALVRIAPEAP